jgi:isopentenyldiphosphate isomerase
MKQEEKLTQLIQTWDNKEKAQAIKLLKSSMAETSTTPKVPSKDIEDYVKNTITEGLKSGGKILNYPGDYEAAARSTYYKQNIRAVIQDVVQELNMDTSSNKVVEECWKELEDSRTLREFRKYLKLYFVALFSNFYTDEDIAEYVEMIDEQDRELRRLREYKRIQEELFKAMTSDDEDLYSVIQARDMKAMGMTDTEICTVLNIKRDKLNYLRKKIELQEKDSV